MLTSREKDITEKLALGWRYAEIAGFYGLSIQTVKNILSRLYAKSNAKNKTELVLKYIGHTLYVTPASERVEFAGGIYPGKDKISRD
jgi:DNA-binding NarL/FixJ family response regulator